MSRFLRIKNSFYNLKPEEVAAAAAAWLCCNVLEIMWTQRWNTGSAYGRNEQCKAVATDEIHSSRGNNSLSSSLSIDHLAIKGCINISTNGGSAKLAPTLSAKVPTAS